MSFQLIKKLDSGIRLGELETPHGKIETPFFMPVGTVGSVKATSPWELEEMGAQILLSNTYHLYLRPGEKLIKDLGGLHKFIGWNKPILTDSGGYQVFSLSQEKTSSKSKALSSKLKENSHLNLQKSLVKITKDGVEFKSHLDGSKHFFTPEKVIDIQLDLGVDILMPLDVCPSGKATKDEVKKAMDITIRWAKRAKKHFDARMEEYPTYASPKVGEENRVSPLNLGGGRGGIRPLLHGIVQGGLYEDLRKECTKELIDLDFDGYSVGGLAVDLETRDMWNIVQMMGEMLPENKQRYLMGVGTPDDIIMATRRGMDMFDCVLPTRMARHGSVYVKVESHESRAKSQELRVEDEDGKNIYFLMNLLNSQYRTDPKPIDENCGCPACQKGFIRAYISHLLRSNEILGLRLTTLHNLWQYLELMRVLRVDN